MIGIIVLILLGILLFLLEFLIIPGTTIAGIGGLILMASGIYLSFENYDSTVGLIVLGASLLVSILILVLALRSRTWKKVMLDTKIDSKVNMGPEAGSISPGDNGIAITRLGPIGKVKINGIIMEGKSLEGYVDANTKIEVIKIIGAQALVKPLK
ncbi:MAG: NfeD family protein [Bacteroidales bacterium]|nr:NfeD family protein [Bacteroidales bacterium]MCF8389431.1 NfeD family protein [Bacteroidales bacterium]